MIPFPAIDNNAELASIATALDTATCSLMINTKTSFRSESTRARMSRCTKLSKSILETRPIYHKRDETIRGHVFCSFLALLLKQELESRETNRSGMGMERGHSRAGCFAAGRSRLPGQTFSIPQPPYGTRLPKRSAPRGGDTALLCGNSSDSIRAGNVVPRHL
jgi:hypothetical protein